MPMNKSLFTALLFCIGLFAQAQKRNAFGKISLDNHWHIQQNGKIGASGEIISTANYSTSQWIPATVPCTVMGALTAHGEYPDLFVGDNYKKADRTRFDDSWWYATPFSVPKTTKGQHIFLHFDGISYRANIYLNGKQLASKDSVFGTFRQFEFDITSLVSAKTNVLAVQVYKAQAGEFNTGFVDWNPRPLDESMGIWRPVYLEITGEVGIKNTGIQSKVNTETLDEAWLSLQTTVVNYSSKTVAGTLQGTLNNQAFSYPVQLAAHETKTLHLTPTELPVLHQINPKLWWSSDLGEPNLSSLTLQFTLSNTTTDQKTIAFGIREIGTYFTPEGHKGFLLNGKKVLIKGAGWTDDLFLRDTKESLETQIQYVKDMHLNTLRFEGFWGNSPEIYSLCDQYGILAMVGWSCQWEWEEYLGKACDEYGGIQGKNDETLILQSLEDQIHWLQNHPSIFVWFLGSDKLPRPELELKYKNLIRQIDDRPYLLTAGTRTSTISGPVGVKMNGPYEYVAPNYWFMDNANGGAFGFNTETSPGSQFPVTESIKKMIPEDKLWPLNAQWDYHCTHSKVAFNKLDVATANVENRYGKATSFEDYMQKSMASEYEALSGMFEAFRARIPKTTGIIQWMLNSAWPSLYWQLYDYYLLPTPSYYAVKKANQPQQLLYDYSNNQIIAVNESLVPFQDLTAQIQVFDFSSQLLFTQKIPFSIDAVTAKPVLTLPEFGQDVWVSLHLTTPDGQAKARNFYWLSHKKDVYDWDKTFWGNTPIKEFADFSALSNLPQSTLQTSCALHKTGTDTELIVTVENTNDRVGFFIELALKDTTNSTVFPVFWEDNYVSILPGEKRVLHCKVSGKDIAHKGYVITINGWNTNASILKID